MSDSAFVKYAKPQEFSRLHPQMGALDIELTERCNNDCIHCCINLPAHDAAARAREMTTAQVKDILQQAADLGCLRVRFTGGEPLLRSDFTELYVYARRLGLQVLLFTNARLVTPQLADLFARIPPRIAIEVTVYGMTASSYDAVTQVPGSFAQFWNGVTLLLERRIPFIVKQSLLPPNRHEIEGFEAWAATIPWMDHRPGYTMNFDLRCRRDDETKNTRIAGLRFPPAETVAMAMREEARYRASNEEFRAKRFMGVPGDRLFSCGACSGKSGCVDAYGRLQPCMGLRMPGLSVDLLGSGSEAGVRLADALARFPALGEMRATNPEYLRRCARCFLKGLCTQCPAKSWAEHGTLDTPVEYLCEVAHAQARCLGWLAADEYGWEAEAPTPPGSTGNIPCSI
jgi:radical SAM protein with 4Fe4S-binding SPASM domain